MNLIIQKLGSGRNFILLAVIAAICFCLYISPIDPSFSFIAGILGIILFFTAVTSLILARKTEIGKEKAALRWLIRQGRESLAFHKDLNFLRSETINLKNELKEIRSEIQKNNDQERKTKYQITNVRPVSHFSPTAIEPTAITDRPSAQSAGRLAANQIMADDGRDKLHYLLNSTPDNRTRKIQVIGSAELIEHLKSVALVAEIHPGQALYAWPEEISYLIIDEELNQINGVWSGFLNAAKTSSFTSLLDLLKKYKERGVVIITLAASIPDHFSSTLRENSHIVYSDGSNDLQWESDIYLPILKTLNDYKNGELSR